MNEENLTLAKKMLDFAGLKDYGIEPSGKEGKIFFINYKGSHAYELWEVSDIWSVSTAEGVLIKKHEDFYFVLKFWIMQMLDAEMDKKFNKVQESLE